MRIGLIWSWFDMLPLTEAFFGIDVELHIYTDRWHRPRWDKSHDLRVEQTRAGLAYMQAKWIEKCIVIPMLEAQMIQEFPDFVLPLFATYMRKYVCKHSLVGKLWLLGEYADQQDAQTYIAQICKNTALTPAQQSTKRFNSSRPVWSKAVPMWTYFLTTYGKRDWMVRKSIKHDLRYFKDADVDTLVPLCRGFLFYTKIIHHMCNWKKLRFHGVDAVGECLHKMITSEGIYSCTLHIDQDIPWLIDQPKRMKMLGRGGEVKIVKK